MVQLGQSFGSTLPPPQPADKLCGVSWLHCGCNRRLGRQGVRTRDGDLARGFPTVVNLCCGSITILSQRHLNFLIYFLIDVLLTSFEGFLHQWVTLVLVA